MSRLFGFLLCGCLYLMGCQTTTHPKNPLIDQIIKPRVGFDGHLTNRSCLEYDGSNCVKEDISTYDLVDPVIRENLNKLSFICTIAGHRYKVCLDKPGFCRKTVDRVCAKWDLLKLFCKHPESWEYIPVENYQYLIDSKTRCFNKENYNFSEMQ